jgi:hypothetical protein
MVLTNSERLKEVIRAVLGGECAARCMDDEEDVEATVDAVAEAVGKRFRLEELPQPETPAPMRIGTIGSVNPLGGIVEVFINCDDQVGVSKYYGDNRCTIDALCALFPKARSSRGVNMRAFINKRIAFTVDETCPNLLTSLDHAPKRKRGK